MKQSGWFVFINAMVLCLASTGVAQGLTEEQKQKLETDLKNFQVQCTQALASGNQTYSTMIDLDSQGKKDASFNQLKSLVAQCKQFKNKQFNIPYGQKNLSTGKSKLSCADVDKSSNTIKFSNACDAIIKDFDRAKKAYESAKGK